MLKQVSFPSLPRRQIAGLRTIVCCQRAALIAELNRANKSAIAIQICLNNGECRAGVSCAILKSTIGCIDVVRYANKTFVKIIALFKARESLHSFALNIIN